MARGTFYTISAIGPKQSLTPEGFLLCEEVPIARTGMMIYGPDETPIDAGPDGIVKIHRDASEVFRTETIASAQGKPVTNDHPETDVTPNDWKELTHGIMLNVRPGIGSMDDLLLADLLITTKDGIKAVQNGKREVSLGYEADYFEIVPGVGKQTNIIINHVALVEQGRCGPRCAINDEKPNLDIEVTMKRRNVNDRLKSLLRRAFKAKDSDDFEEIVKDAEELGLEETKDEELPESTKEDEEIHIHVDGQDESEKDFRTTDDELWEQNAAEHAALGARIDALEALVSKLSGTSEESFDEESEEASNIEQAMLDEVPEGLEEEAAKAKDSRYLGESFKDTVAMAEILSPGIKVPTFDSAANPVQTFKKICRFRRQALDNAYSEDTGKSILDELLVGRTLNTKNMTCDAVRTLFNSAAATKRRMNNSSGVRDSLHKPVAPKQGITSLADLNRKNAELFSK